MADTENIPELLKAAAFPAKVYATVELRRVWTKTAQLTDLWECQAARKDGQTFSATSGTTFSAAEAIAKARDAVERARIESLKRGRARAG